MFKQLLLILFFALPAYSQDGVQITYTDSVTVDSTDEEVLYFNLYDRYGSKGFSDSYVSSGNSVHITNHLFVSGEIDSLTASSPNDSITIKIDQIDRRGNVLASSTIFLDFANNDSSATATYLNSFTPYNRESFVGGTTQATYWCELDSFLVTGCYALKITVNQVQDNEGTSGQHKVVINLTHGTKKLSY